jgi:hypothetical protein
MAGESRDALCELGKVDWRSRVPVAGHAGKLGNHYIRPDGIQCDQVMGGVDRMDVPRSKGFWLKVAEVEGDDRGSAGADGCGKHVPVLDVVYENGFEAVGTVDHRFWEIHRRRLSGAGGRSGMRNLPSGGEKR